MNVNLDNYSADLARFVEHASQHTTVAGGGDATIVRAESVQVGTPGRPDARGFRPVIWNRDLRLADTNDDKVGGFSALFRSRANKEANNATRDLFKSAVAEMFGGEDNIPENVRAAMKMKDYGKGRPLTARRIMAVKTAIDAAIGNVDYSQFVPAILKQAKAYCLPVPTGEQFHDLVRTAADYQAATGCRVETAVASLFTISLKTVSKVTDKIRKSVPFEMAVRSFGYDADQCENLAKAAAFYQRAMRCSIDRAVESACSPTGVANRLMNCGGRFMTSAENFRHGVRLIGKFDALFRDVCDGRRPKPKNALSEQFQEKNLRGFAHFVFADIAHNASTELAELSPEKLLDFTNNPVASFFGRGANRAFTATLLQVSPEKRGIVFRTYNVLCPPTSSVTGFDSRFIFIARMLKHLDVLIALENKKGGNPLTAAEVGRTCFPEIASSHSSKTFDTKTIDDFFNKRINDFSNRMLAGVVDEGGPLGTQVGVALLQRLTDSGEEIDRVIEAYEKSESLSSVPYQASYGGDLEMLNGSTAYARNQFIGDFRRDVDEVRQSLERNLGVSRIEGGNELPKEVVAERVADKIETLCGKGNWRQATAVLLSLSQAGRTNLVYRPGMESSDVLHTLSQDPETGTVTIVCSNTPSDAVNFRWEVAIERNGNTTVTPMKIRNR